MIRSLKILLAAAMALSALGAIGASGAQAANEFHCSVEPCTVTIKPDGPVPNKTAHHVLIITQGAVSVSSTCNQLSGEGTVAHKTFTEITFTNLKYTGCNIAGSSSEVRINDCHFRLNAFGVNAALVTLACVDHFEITEPVTGCTIKVGPQKAAVPGVTFNDPKTGGIAKTELTASFALTIQETILVNSKCGGFGLAEGAATLHYTTGNVELTAETHAGAHASLWYQ